MSLEYSRLLHSATVEIARVKYGSIRKRQAELGPWRYPGHAAAWDHSWIQGPTIARVYIDVYGLCCCQSHIDAWVWVTTCGYDGIRGPCCPQEHLDLSDLCCQPGPWCCLDQGCFRGLCLDLWSYSNQILSRCPRLLLSLRVMWEDQCLIGHLGSRHCLGTVPHLGSWMVLPPGTVKTSRHRSFSRVMSGWCPCLQLPRWGSVDAQGLASYLGPC